MLPRLRPATVARSPLVALLAAVALVCGLGVVATGLAPAAQADVPNVQAQVQNAVAIANARGERASAAVLDRVTGQFWGAGDYDSLYASASVVKVAIATELLVTGQMTGSTADLAYSMITRSDDDAATALYGRVGGDNVMPTVAARYGLSQYFARPTAAGWWGLTQISAHGIVLLYDRIGRDPVVSPWLVAAMAAAQCTAKDGWPQCFGIPSFALGWRVKQGWMCCLDNLTRMHSTGFVNNDRFTVALLTEGSRSVYGQYGRDTVTQMARAVMPDGQVYDPDKPVGYLDSATAFGAQVTVRGWTTDPDTPGVPLDVDLYVDGAFVQRTHADQARPDLQAVGFPVQSGYVSTMNLAIGAHTVCAYALNAGAGTVNPQLGCRPVTVSSSPWGRLESTASDPGTTVVKGWAIDPDQPSTALTVHVYVDGVFAGAGPADVARPDVNAVTGEPGNHAFLFPVAVSPGLHTICVYALDIGRPGGTNTGLGCQTGGYDGLPHGSIEFSNLAGTWLRVTGWVRDPAVSGPLQVDLWDGSQYLGSVQAAASRTDIDAMLGVTGSRGFDTTVTVPLGTSTVTAYAINTHAANANPAIGAVTVSGTASPVGALDSVVPAAGGFTVKGWAADPDLGSFADTVHVYVDGVFATQLAANQPRADVTAFTGIPGQHGYQGVAAVGAGVHQVCVYALNAGPGEVTTLGCVSTSR